MSEQIKELPDYEGFEKYMDEKASFITSIPKNEKIRIVSHIDADGICSAAIFINALIKMNRKYVLTTLQTITEESVMPIVEDDDKYIVFVDLGSGSLNTIIKTFKDKNVLILDHHIPEARITPSNIVQVNPHLFNVDGSIEVSGAGVVYLYSNRLIDNKEMSRIAIVGAIGDVQENNGFKKVNSSILKDAVDNKLIEVRKGLKFFGTQTRPIHKILQYSSEVMIPGVTGSESGAISFLQSININPQLKNGWKKISDLSDEEKKKLVANIVMKIPGLTPNDIISNIYLLTGEDSDSPFRDAKEFSTLLNSCGRLNKVSIGIGACLNDKRMKELALQNLYEYRREIVTAMNWYKDNSNTDRVIKKKNYLIINAQEEVLPTMIGTLGSILSKSNDVAKNTFILGLARNYDNTTKISLRVVGNPYNVNLKEIIGNIVTMISHGTAGGHSFAAGAVINTEYEDAFMAAADKVFSAVTIEEKI